MPFIRKGRTMVRPYIWLSISLLGSCGVVAAELSYQVGDCAGKE